ncbi:hypothetical protein [uncultured Dysosmobacter sp.]|uniref:hypothetical protein n=1 Tax=uncultured Dysosmobacter sp. TaxID=2591384 RepID=UPI00262016A7|nr:hypothetical protein [uncultured Dysosmobacter sp.]
MRWKTVLLAALSAALLAGCGGQVAREPAEQEAVPLQREPAAQEPAAETPENENALPQMADGLPDWAEAYFIQALAHETEVPEAEYALIDLTGGEIPALAAGHSGYEASLYQYGGGELHTLMDHWPYGTCGNGGYAYLPGRSVIRNYSTGSAGAILYTSYHRVTADWGLEGYTLELWNFQDQNQNGVLDEEETETLGQTAYYYYDPGKLPLTAEEYDSYAIGGKFDYEEIRGGKCCREFLEELNGLTVKNNEEDLS